jgi:hypothetical protein
MQEIAGVGKTNSWWTDQKNDKNMLFFAEFIEQSHSSTSNLAEHVLKQECIDLVIQDGSL